MVSCCINLGFSNRCFRDIPLANGLRICNEGQRECKSDKASETCSVITSDKFTQTSLQHDGEDRPQSVATKKMVDQPKMNQHTSPRQHKTVNGNAQVDDLRCVRSKKRKSNAEVEHLMDESSSSNKLVKLSPGSPRGLEIKCKSSNVCNGSLSDSIDALNLEHTQSQTRKLQNRCSGGNEFNRRPGRHGRSSSSHSMDELNLERTKSPPRLLRNKHRFSKRLLEATLKNADDLRVSSKQKSPASSANAGPVRPLSLKKHMSSLRHHSEPSNPEEIQHAHLDQVLESVARNIPIPSISQSEHLDEVLECVARNIQYASPVPFVKSSKQISKKYLKKRRICLLREKATIRVPLELRRLDIDMLSPTRGHSLPNGHGASDTVVPPSPDSSELADCRVVVKRLSSGSSTQNRLIRNKLKDRYTSGRKIRRKFFLRQALATKEKISKCLAGREVARNHNNTREVNPVMPVLNKQSLVKLAASTKHLTPRLHHCFDSGSNHEDPEMPHLEIEPSVALTKTCANKSKRKQPSSAIRKVVSELQLSQQNVEDKPLENGDVENVGADSFKSPLYVDVFLSDINSPFSPSSPLPELNKKSHQQQVLLSSSSCLSRTPGFQKTR